MDWKSRLKRIAIATGLALLFLARHLFALLAALMRFIARCAIPAAWRWLRGTALPALRRFYTWLPHRRMVAGAAAGIAVIAIAVLLVRTPGTAAPGDQPGTVAVPDEPVILTLSPMEGPPGAAIALGGLIQADGMSLEVTVGGEPSSAMWLPDGTLQTRVPLYLGPDSWPSVPSNPQIVEVHRNGVLIAASRDGLRVTPLQRAPGSTARVQRSLDTAVGAYERIFEALPALDERDRTHRRALMKALRGLVSEGDYSLAAILAGESPLLEGAEPDLELVDALMASTGTATSLEAFANALGSGPATGGGSVAPTAGAGLPMLLVLPSGLGLAGPKCRGSGKDMELACLMQIQGLLDDLANEYIRPTADAWANFTLLRIGSHPVSATISALLSVANLVIGKVAPALLPASLTQFELEIPDPLIRRRDMTDSRIMVAARNQPQSITLNDLVDVLKSTVGQAVKFKIADLEHLKKFFFRVVDLYMAALRGVDAVRPGTSDLFQKDILVLPQKSWGPIEVTNSDLVTLFSYDPSIVSAQEEEMEWRGERAGQATVRVMPRTPGERSKVLEDHTLCWGCAWRGGAFGTDMPESSKRVSVDIRFEASPPRGLAPLDVDLSWKLLPREDGQPEACTVDFGDGTAPERISDCTRTHSVSHTYPYTSRLNGDTGGAWLPSIRLDANGAESEAEVFTEWTFRGTPGTGQAPLEARFSWDIPWPQDRKAPACEFDPGDGSRRQRFNDCLAVTETEHTFEQHGSFVPALTIIDGGAKDTRTAPVSVAREGTCDESLLQHKAWKGTVSYSYGRDFWNRTGTEHIVYTMDINVTSEMPEEARRTDRNGDDTLVKYFSPAPQGGAHATYQHDEYRRNGDLRRSGSFEGSSIRSFDENLEDRQSGSMLGLSLDATACTYMFHVQAWVDGTAREIEGQRETTFRSRMAAGGVLGQGPITSPTSISGSAPFRAYMPGDEIPDGESAVWALETPVSEEDPHLGSATVTWDFRPVD